MKFAFLPNSLLTVSIETKLSQKKREFSLQLVNSVLCDDDIIITALMYSNISTDHYDRALPVGLAPDGNIVMISALEIKG